MEESKKTYGEQLAEELCYSPKHAGEVVSDEELAKINTFCEDYKTFLDHAKIEREAVITSIELAKERGYTEFVPGSHYQPGDKVYFNNRGKAVIFSTIGTKSLKEGVRIAAAHIDSPRLDLKPNPMYQDNDLAYLKTHYYGGIRKYQWATLPLALHGVVITRDGKTVTVNIGEDENDPVFCTTDLLPHLAANQNKRTLGEGIQGEELNILIGSMPIKDDKAGEKVKLNILKILHEKYGIVESDFLSAELAAVPREKAKDLGFDRSMIGSYGHDDRVCAYAALMAEFEAKNPEYTTVTVLTDKEEVGSDGNTGLNSSYMKYFIEMLAEAEELPVHYVLSKSKCLSADVNAAFDPTFPDVSEKNNCSYLNKGVVITKYTGSRGKGGTSDASAEFMGEIRRMLDENGVVWQIGELGKVDMGGGGTVAKFIANLDVDVIDLGVPVLSMHAPFEVVAKTDVYMAYRAFACFYGNK